MLLRRLNRQLDQLENALDERRSQTGLPLQRFLALNCAVMLRALRLFPSGHNRFHRAWDTLSVPVSGCARPIVPSSDIGDKKVRFQGVCVSGYVAHVASSNDSLRTPKWRHPA